MAAHSSQPHAPTQPAPLPDGEQPPRQGPGSKAWRQMAAMLGWRRPPAADAVLTAARAAFTASLADLPAPDTNDLRHLLGHALSLEELWHLRPELYRHLALHHSQAEAQHRLALLNSVFTGVRVLQPVAPPSPT